MEWLSTWNGALDATRAPSLAKQLTEPPKEFSGVKCSSMKWELIPTFKFKINQSYAITARIRHA
jgi:ribosome-binding factor A